jgi:hypothetical protein
MGNHGGIITARKGDQEVRQSACPPMRRRSQGVGRINIQIEECFLGEAPAQEFERVKG